MPARGSRRPRGRWAGDDGAPSAHPTRRRFAEQWAEAVAVVPGLDTPARGDGGRLHAVGRAGRRGRGALGQLDADRRAVRSGAARRCCCSTSATVPTTSSASPTGSAPTHRKASPAPTTCGTSTPTCASSMAGSIAEAVSSSATSAPATSSPAPTCGCSTPGWCRATPTGGATSPRCTRRCARRRPGTPDIARCPEAGSDEP